MVEIYLSTFGMLYLGQVARSAVELTNQKVNCASPVDLFEPPY